MLRHLTMAAVAAAAMLVAAPSQAGCCVKTSYTKCRKPCALTIKPCKAPDWCKVGTPACCVDNITWKPNLVPAY